MKIYKNLDFAEWADKEGISNIALQEAIIEIEQGLYDANLGGGLYKKRVRRAGGGKSGGYRTFVAFKQDDKAIFLFGFSKSERVNITDKELGALKKLSKDYLAGSVSKIEIAIQRGKLMEVKND